MRSAYRDPGSRPREGFEFFDDLRRQYFPPDLNLIPAHVSLFHRLPGEELTMILETLEEAEFKNRLADARGSVTGSRKRRMAAFASVVSQI